MAAGLLIPPPKPPRGPKYAAAIGLWLVLMSMPLAIIGVPDPVGTVILAVGIASVLTGGLLIVTDRIKQG